MEYKDTHLHSFKAAQKYVLSERCSLSLPKQKWLALILFQIPDSKDTL